MNTWVAKLGRAKSYMRRWGDSETADMYLQRSDFRGSKLPKIYHHTFVVFHCPSYIIC